MRTVSQQDSPPSVNLTTWRTLTESLTRIRPRLRSTEASNNASCCLLGVALLFAYRQTIWSEKRLYCVKTWPASVRPFSMALKLLRRQFDITKTAFPSAPNPTNNDVVGLRRGWSTKPNGGQGCSQYEPYEKSLDIGSTWRLVY
ncbi:hypothetical protein MRB53_041051 [Persea americana]|nr:hypothetical protein MRB53_041051 [Persea americana]